MYRTNSPNRIVDFDCFQFNVLETFKKIIIGNYRIPTNVHGLCCCERPIAFFTFYFRKYFGILRETFEFRTLPLYNFLRKPNTIDHQIWNLNFLITVLLQSASQNALLSSHIPLSRLFNTLDKHSLTVKMVFNKNSIDSRPEIPPPPFSRPIVLPLRDEVNRNFD